MTAVKDICLEEFAGVSQFGGETTCVFQVLTKTMIEASKRNGRNAMGLDSETSPMLLFNVYLSWEQEANSDTFSQLAKTIISRTTEYGAKINVNNDLKYMNYAGEFQDVTASYGAANKAKLISVSEKYDPTGVFQKLQPDWFKLEGAPADMKK